MPTWQYELMDPPADPRALELWLQHAAGFVVWEDVRKYATEQIDADLSAEVRAAVGKGIDDAIYGLMMVIDGVTGSIASERRSVYIDFIVRLAERSVSEKERVVAEVNLKHGDGMCMGFHGWRQGDFGEDPIAVRRPTQHTTE